MLTDRPQDEEHASEPTSADHGFFGSKPFSRTNTLLPELAADPIDWSLP